ncbi:hypothetical protein OVA11_14300 [Caulobacter sp. SL161]|nr:hypothetical protein [Caulobacter sp. SL161]MCY1648192.1 hypothetical protein [Caulobacter sp. SL161]
MEEIEAQKAEIAELKCSVEALARNLQALSNQRSYPRTEREEIEWREQLGYARTDLAVEQQRLELARGQLDALLREQAKEEARKAEERDRAERQLEDQKLAELHRANLDDSTYWLRRLMLQPQLGNGAAFLALAGGVLQADDIQAAAQLAKEPFSWFAAGLAVSAVPPYFLWASRSEPKLAKAFETAAFYFTLLSGAFFLVGLWDGVMVMRHAKQALAEQTKAGSPPTSPSAPAAKSPPPSLPRETPAPPPRKSEPQGAAAQPAADHKDDRG